MRHMNRVLVGTMLEVAGGRRTVRDFERLLTGRPRVGGGPRRRRPTGSTSPRCATENRPNGQGPQE